MPKFFKVAGSLRRSIVLKLAFPFEKYKTASKKVNMLLFSFFLHFFAAPGLSKFLMQFSKIRNFVVAKCNAARVASLNVGQNTRNNQLILKCLK